MRNNIDNFFNLMETILPNDIIKHIIYNINLKSNLLIIKKQRNLKNKINKDIIKLFNTYYRDNNFLLYKNNKGQFILENHRINNNNILIYSNRSIDDNDNNQNNENRIELNNRTYFNDDNIDTEKNEIILFDESSSTPFYDENGILVRPKINLDIIYML